MTEITPHQLHKVLKDISIKHDVVISQGRGMLTPLSIGIACIVGGLFLGPVGMVAGGLLTWAGIRYYLTRKVSALTVLDSLDDEDIQSLHERFKTVFQAIDTHDQIALEKMIASNKVEREQIIETLKTYLSAYIKAKAAAHSDDSTGIIIIT